MTDTAVKPPQTEEYYIGEIGAALRKSVEGYFQAGKALTEAKDALGFTGDQWQAWLGKHFQISNAYASRLMKVAGSQPLFAHVQNGTLASLPKDIETLASLAGVEAPKLTGDLRMTREEARKLAKDHPIQKARTGRGRPRGSEPKLTVAQIRHKLEVTENDLARLADVQANFDKAVEEAVSDEKTAKIFTMSVEDLADGILQSYSREDITILIELIDGGGAE
jgi:hypothetical protein